MKKQDTREFTCYANTHESALAGLERKIVSHAEEHDHPFYQVGVLDIKQRPDGHYAYASVEFYSF
ncbi:MAG: hypothetical protein ACP5D2_00115 [Candidatus Nanoarchaeia archaeon]